MLLIILTRYKVHKLCIQIEKKQGTGGVRLEDLDKDLVSYRIPQASAGCRKAP